MKFLMISSYLPSVLNFRGKLLEAIAAQGHEVVVIAPNHADFPEQVTALTQLGYTVLEVPMQRTGTNPLADLNTLFALYRVIRRVQPDMVLSYTIKPVIYGTWAAWLARVPQRFALITGLGYAFQRGEGQAKSLFQRAVHGLYKKALTYSDKVFFQNPDDLALFRHMKLIERNKPAVVVNGSGVDLAKFDQVELPRQANGQPKVAFLLIARLLGDKGVREYAAAAAKIKATHPEIEFHLVGWIDQNPSAIDQKELDQWVQEQRVTYWGKLKDVRPAIAATSVYVLPSYREGTPRTVLEAMAMGRAVITTDAPGCRETVIEGENGHLVAVKSVDALVNAMQQCIDQPARVEDMGQRSREIALTKYDVHRVNVHMLTEMGVKPSC